AARPYDLVIASQVDMARYRACFAGVPALFEEVEVGTLYEQFRRAEGAAQRLRYGLTWQKHRRYLAGLLRSYQAATVVSAPERALVAEQVAGDAARLRVIANGVDVASYADVAAEPAAHTLIFAGSFSYLPNYHAMQWFIEHVFPRVRTAVPGTRLVITGRHGDRPLPSLDGVELTGFVDDVRPRIKGAWLSVAPIWIGGGTRLKILEAMALGTPVVATHKGAEGLDLVNGRDIVLADEPAAFADAVIGLLRDPAARQALAARGLQRVREVYDWQVILPQFMGLVAETAVAANGRTG
ncbi:MAG: glycosyltransferase, partial [Anaerolineales bacterium]|nr:glycosyltransferase [Anaerolineales bacterium]